MNKLKNLNLFILRQNFAQLNTRGQQRLFSLKEDKNTSEEEKNFIEKEADDENGEVNLNHSRLLPQHYRLVKKEVPYQEAKAWYHSTEKYQRKIYGTFGSSSGVNPRICFPTIKEIQESKLRDHTTESLNQMIEKSKKERSDRIEQIKQREEMIAKKLEKLDNWKNELNIRIAKKEADALAAKERKERLIEEVRRHFGFKVDPRDDRFKEMLELKEKEDRKKQKEAKRKAKEEKLMAKISTTVQ